jgi:hypothetical protein
MSKLMTVVAVVLAVLSLAANPASAASLDFSTCADAGDAFDQCVAGIAQAFQPGDEQSAPAHGVNALVDGCSTFTGAQFGACMAAAVQGAHDRGDPSGTAVSEAARLLVDGCRGQAGRDFGACVSAAAHELGHGRADRRATDGDASTDSGDADDGGGHPPTHHGKPATTDRPADGEKPTHGGKPARPGGH